jgi:hypothetical protein
MLWKLIQKAKNSSADLSTYPATLIHETLEVVYKKYIVEDDRDMS